MTYISFSHVKYKFNDFFYNYVKCKFNIYFSNVKYKFNIYFSKAKYKFNIYFPNVKYNFNTEKRISHEKYNCFAYKNFSKRNELFPIIYTQKER